MKQYCNSHRNCVTKSSEVTVMNLTNVTKYWLKALVNTVVIKESLCRVGAKKDVSIFRNHN